MRLGLAVIVVAAVGCRAPAAAQGGAGFREVIPEAPAVPVSALFGVCWPEDALPSQGVELTWHAASEVSFEAKGGASNATARCVREIAASVPGFRPPGDALSVGPPVQPLDGWAVLAWVKLLAPGRFGPERGLVDPAPLVRACLGRGAPRSHVVFSVRHVPGPEIKVLPQAVSEAERCIEAVLGSTAWPSGRSVSFVFDGVRGASAGKADEVGLYFAAPSTAARAIDPTVVKEAMGEARPKVGRCWDEALARRPSIGGSRTFRFRADERGAVSHAWVAGLGEAASAADYRLDRCLEQVLRELHFAGGAGEGVYTWVFAARD